MVADRAEEIGGKLYVMGGAWDRLSIPDFAQPLAFGVALVVSVPWTAAGDHAFSIRLEKSDGKLIATLTSGTLGVRPGPNALAGCPLRTPVAVGGLLVLPGSGQYRVVAQVGGGPTRATVFRAEGAAPPPLAMAYPAPTSLM